MLTPASASSKRHLRSSVLLLTAALLPLLAQPACGDEDGKKKAPTKFLNTGFTLGGPIIRNKLFFFGAYQRTVDNGGYIVRAPA